MILVVLTDVPMAPKGSFPCPQLIRGATTNDMSLSLVFPCVASAVSGRRRDETDEADYQWRGYVHVTLFQTQDLGLPKPVTQPPVTHYFATTPLRLGASRDEHEKADRCITTSYAISRFIEREQLTHNCGCYGFRFRDHATRLLPA